MTDDEPAPAHAWISFLAETLKAKPPLHIPGWLARPLIGEHGIVMMRDMRGVSNEKPNGELDWKLLIPVGEMAFGKSFYSGSPDQDSSIVINCRDVVAFLRFYFLAMLSAIHDAGAFLAIRLAASAVAIYVDIGKPDQRKRLAFAVFDSIEFPNEINIVYHSYLFVCTFWRHFA